MRHKEKTWWFVWGNGRYSINTYTNSVGGQIQGLPWGHHLQSPKYRAEKLLTMKSMSLLVQGPTTFRQQGPLSHSGEKKANVSRRKRSETCIYVVTVLPWVDPQVDLFMVCGWLREKTLWLPASENSHSRRKDKLYIHEAINSSDNGIAQVNTVRESWLKEWMNKIIKEMKYRKTSLIMSPCGNKTTKQNNAGICLNWM